MEAQFCDSLGFGHRMFGVDILFKFQELGPLVKFIFGIELYMFRTVSLSIIRSLALYTQQ
jgi:hypothetical protein